MSLLSFCASHINSEFRMNALVSMIQSWEHQSSPVPLWISISLDSSLSYEVKFKCLSMLNLLQKKHSSKLFQWFLRPTACRQFVHYQFLVEKSQDLDASTWILCTDDDDTWHSKRVERYQQHIKEDISSSDVDVVFAEYEMKNIGIRSEYHDFAVQLGVWREFMQRVPPLLLTSRWCDLFFSRFFKFKKTTISTFKTLDELYQFTPTPLNSREKKRTGGICDDGDKNYIRESLILHIARRPVGDYQLITLWTEFKREMDHCLYIFTSPEGDKILRQYWNDYSNHPLVEIAFLLIANEPIVQAALQAPIR